VALVIRLRERAHAHDVARLGQQPLHLVTEPLVAPGLGDHCHHGNVAGEHLAHLDVAVFHTLRE